MEKSKVALGAPNSGAVILDVARIDEDHVVVMTKMESVRRVPRVPSRILGFFFRKKPNEGWYIVPVAEVKMDATFRFPADIREKYPEAILCEDDDKQDDLLDRLCMVIEGHLVEPQYA